jgi:transposase-like protein
MCMTIDGQARDNYTLEFKLKAVRLVIDGQAATVTSKVLGVPNQTYDNWVSSTGPTPGEN